MSEVISLWEARHPSAAPGLRSPNKISATVYEKVPEETTQQSLRKEDIFRAILLLDLAGQHARLLVKQIADPARRENFQTQIATIDQLLQLARDLALKL